MFTEEDGITNNNEEDGITNNNEEDGITNNNEGRKEFEIRRMLKLTQI